MVMPLGVSKLDFTKTWKMNWDSVDTFLMLVIGRALCDHKTNEETTELNMHILIKYVWIIDAVEHNTR